MFHSAGFLSPLSQAYRPAFSHTLSALAKADPKADIRYLISHHRLEGNICDCVLNMMKQTDGVESEGLYFIVLRNEIIKSLSHK